MKKEKKQVRDPGKEYLDPTPIEVPSGLKRPETVEQKIKRILATHISIQAEQSGAESWDEAHDFNIDDPFDEDEYKSKYEVIDMKPEFPTDMPSVESEKKANGGAEDPPVANKGDENAKHSDKVVGEYDKSGIHFPDIEGYTRIRETGGRIVYYRDRRQSGTSDSE